MAQLNYVHPLHRDHVTVNRFGMDVWMTVLPTTEGFAVLVRPEHASLRAHRQGLVPAEQVLAEARVLVTRRSDVNVALAVHIADAGSLHTETVQRINRLLDGSGLQVGKYNKMGTVALRVPRPGSKRSEWVALPAVVHLTRVTGEPRWTVDMVNGKRPTPAKGTVAVGMARTSTRRPTKRTFRPLAPQAAQNGPAASETVRTGETATQPHIVAPEPSGALKVKPPATTKVDPLGIFKFPTMKSTHDIVVSREVREELDRLWGMHVAGERQIMAMTGPTGTGKTSLAYALAARHGVGIFKFDVAGARQFEDWTGMTGLGENRTEFQFSAFLKAIDADGPYAGQPRIVVLDEANRAMSTSAANALLPICDDVMTLFIPELGRMVNIDPAVLLVLTMNIGSQYGGTVALDRALVDRITHTQTMDYLDFQAEIGVVIERAKVDEGVARRLVQAAAMVRSAANRGDLPEGGGISTRNVIMAAKKVAAGFAMDTAALKTWLLPYPDDGSDSEAATVRQAIQSVLGR